MRPSNPYRPGFNQSPVLLAGRGDVLESLAEALEVTALDARTPRPLVLVGGRGVGKSVLLEEARRMAAEEHSWTSVSVEVSPGQSVLPSLVTSLSEAKRLYEQRPAAGPGRRVEKATVRAGIGGTGVEAEVTRVPGSSPFTYDDLWEPFRDAMGAAMLVDAGLLLTVDEVHLASKGDFASIAALLQRATGERMPLVAVLAGLPSMRDPRRMVTYTERAEWHELGLLPEAETRRAFTEPALSAGRPMDAGASDHLVRASGGYPYAVRVLGHHAWRASSGVEVIDVHHALIGETATQRDFANGLFGARWDDCPPREKECVLALADLLTQGRAPTGADVATALGQPQPAVAHLRARLVEKGTIYSQSRVLRFAVPGTAAWVANREDD